MLNPNARRSTDDCVESYCVESYCTLAGKPRTAFAKHPLAHAAGYHWPSYIMTLLEPDTRQLERLLVNASWLHRLRWVAVIGQLGTVTAVSLAFGIQLNLLPLLLIILFTALTNVGFLLWIQTHRQATNPPTDGVRLMGTLMVLDLTSLTGLLYFAGGPANPFTVFFFVNLALSAVVLPSRWSWGMTAFAIGCCCLIFLHHEPLPELGRDLGWSALSVLSLQQLGLLVALLTCASVVIYFITRVNAEVRQQDRELQDAREHQARTEKLESLATLAAGAGHELASPLSTIAVVTNELTHLLERFDVDESVIKDVQLIRSEVDQCRIILDRMAGHAGQAVGEQVTSVTMQQLMDEIIHPIHGKERVNIVGSTALDCRMVVPVEGLSQALRGVLQNALDASDPDDEVEIRLDLGHEKVTLTFVDRGAGMPQEVLARAGEPFYTTKEPGKGMGLGLFLARSVIERLHGTMHIDSVEGERTTVTITLPV